MLLPVVLLLSLLLAAAFGAIASREISRAGRAEQDTAARHRFLAAFDQRGAERVPAELLVRTFEIIAARREVPRPALRPTARLARDLGMTAADVEDAALLVAARCEGQLPHGCDLDALAYQVRTVEDFVRFLAPFVEGQAPQPAHAA